jgi:hypothetical protein
LKVLELRDAEEILSLKTTVIAESTVILLAFSDGLIETTLGWVVSAAVSPPEPVSPEELSLEAETVVNFQELS